MTTTTTTTRSVATELPGTQWSHSYTRIVIIIIIVKVSLFCCSSQGQSLTHPVHVIYRIMLHNQNMLLYSSALNFILLPSHSIFFFLRTVPPLVSSSIRNNTIPSSSSSKNNYPFTVQQPGAGGTEWFPWNATGGESIP